MSAQSPWFLSPSSSSSVTNPISTPVFVGSFCHPIRSNWVRTTLCTIQDEKMNIFDTTNHESPLFYPHYLLNPTLIAMIWWSNPWFAASISIESNCPLNIPPIWCWLISPLFFHFCEKNHCFCSKDLVVGSCWISTLVLPTSCFIARSFEGAEGLDSYGDGANQGWLKLVPSWLFLFWWFLHVISTEKPSY